MSDKANIAILGTGMAGYGLARELRQAGCRDSITMLTVDNGDVYAKPKLSNSLTQGKGPEDLVDTTAIQIAAELELDIRTHSLVKSLDTDAHRLEIATVPQQMQSSPDLVFADRADCPTATTLEYDHLVLATGSSPVRLPLGGQAATDVLSVNSLADYRIFRQLLAEKNAKRVAVIGPGLVGCEFANDLLSANLQVSIIGPDPWPLSLLIPEPPARLLQSALAQRGADWHLQTCALSVEHSSDGYAIELDNGQQLQADLVLSAVGIRPELQLARLAGLETAGGVVADSHLRTSAPDVYCLGDAAEIEGVVRLFIAPIRLCAKALAQTLTGTPTPVRLPPQPVGIKTSIHPINLLPAGPGASAQADNWQCETDSGGAIARYYRDGGDNALAGFVLTGDKVRQRAELMRELGTVPD